LSSIEAAATQILIATYAAVLAVLTVYGLHRYWIVFLYWRHHKRPRSTRARPPLPADFRPVVTVQLPVYNERYVVERLIETVCALEYPRENLEIQVLDDSTDDTVAIASAMVERMRALGFDIHHLRRGTRAGYKAGALAWGLTRARGEFVAIFDADFMPPPGFLTATLPHFIDPRVGMVQTRWGHINAGYSMLTRLQALFLDGHFLLEHTARYKSGAFFNFNGTAGIWRARAITSAGGWSARTLTEDLDLSYRAQLAGWKFVYDPDFVCPAELPVDIHAFQTQQSRWTKGALQVARHILKDLWKARLPLHTKLEATVHLTGNLGYLLTIVVAVLLLPSLFLRDNISINLGLIEICIFLATSLSISFFYAFSQRELYPDWRWRMRDLPALLSFGIGMCASNARAVLDGIFGHESEFIRTPKYDIRSGGDSWVRKVYARGNRRNWRLHAAFCLYSLATLATAAFESHWAAVPFILLFVFGFGYVTGLSFLHAADR
jgi:cellulose synthase/poly-beta-1,6-N-acetylglucosamine synthase-like glycosyltransferase